MFVKSDEFQFIVITQKVEKTTFSKVQKKTSIELLETPCMVLLLWRRVGMRPDKPKSRKTTFSFVSPDTETCSLIRDT